MAFRNTQPPIYPGALASQAKAAPPTVVFIGVECFLYWEEAHGCGWSCNRLLATGLHSDGMCAYRLNVLLSAYDLVFSARNLLRSARDLVLSASEPCVKNHFRAARLTTGCALRPPSILTYMGRALWY